MGCSFGGVKTGFVEGGKAVMVWSSLWIDLEDEEGKVVCVCVRLNSAEVLGNTRSKFTWSELCDEMDGLIKTAGSDENSPDEGDGGEEIGFDDNASWLSESESGTTDLLLRYVGLELILIS